MRTVRPKSASQAKRPDSITDIAQSNLENRIPIDHFQSNLNKIYSPAQFSAYSNIKKLKRKIVQYKSKTPGKTIPIDKEKLYFESIKLKQQMNNLEDENIKLKTQMTKLQKENQRLQKQMEINVQCLQTSKSRFYSNGLGEVQSSRIPAMKRLIRETNKQMKLLKVQNENVKKSVKYTKITQLQKENMYLLQEMNRMSKIIDDISNQQKRCLLQKIKLQEQKEFAKMCVKQSKQISQKKQELENQIKKSKQQARHNLLKQNKILLDLQLNQKKLDQAQKQISNLRTNIKQLQNINLKQEKNITNNNQDYNFKLQGQLKSLKNTNEDLSKRNIQLLQIIKSQSQSLPLNATKYTSNEGNDECCMIINQENIQLGTFQQQKKLQSFEQQQEDSDQYEQIINLQGLQDFKQKIKTKQTKQKTENNYIKQLKKQLTLRIKAQRYTFEEIKSKISSTQKDRLLRADIIDLLRQQPFFLNKNQIQLVLVLLFPQQIDNYSILIPRDTLIQTLQTLVLPFNLRDQIQSNTMKLKIREAILSDTISLLERFDELKNSDSDFTMTQERLRSVFVERGFQKQQIDYIIEEVCLNSSDLNNLKCEQFFSVFQILKREEQSYQTQKSSEDGVLQMIDQEKGIQEQL